MSFKCRLVNAQSLRNKTERLSNILAFRGYQFFFVNKSLLSSEVEEKHLIRQSYSSSTNYKLFNLSRTHGRDGGLICLNLLSRQCSQNLEAACFERKAKELVHIWLVYRPPSSRSKSFWSFLENGVLRSTLRSEMTLLDPLFRCDWPLAVTRLSMSGAPRWVLFPLANIRWGPRG